MKKQYFLYILSVLTFACLAQEEKVFNKISSAITWEPNGGRFGDNLFSYSKAKWLSYKYNIPILCVPFPYADQLMLHMFEDMYTHESAHQFKKTVYLPVKSKYTLSPHSNTLYISHWHATIAIDWNDKIFLEELKKNIAPINEIQKTPIPDNCLSIAVHVRNGGGFVVDDQQERERCPLRFVPDEFFIAQIERIAALFPEDNLYVYIFTDHKEPIVLMKKFEQTLNNQRITFDCRKHNNHHKANVLEDFFSMMDFDCLIRPGSHFSRFVQRLGNNKIVIYPESVKKIKGKSVIDVINIKTRPYPGAQWKTKKITIA